MSNPFSAKPGMGDPDDHGAELEKAPIETGAGQAEAPGAISNVDSTAEKGGASAPTLGMDEVSCRTCRYLEFEGSARVSALVGECRRHAPAPGMDRIASWPRVTWQGWCGEWESGVSDEDMVKMARAIADRQVEGASKGFLKSGEDRG